MMQLASTIYGTFKKNLVDYINYMVSTAVAKTYSVTGTTSCSISGLDFSIGKSYKFSGSVVSGNADIPYLRCVAGTYTCETWNNGTRTSYSDTGGVRLSAADSNSYTFHGSIHIGESRAFIELTSATTPYSQVVFAYGSVPITNTVSDGYIAISRTSATKVALRVEEDK